MSRKVNPTSYRLATRKKWQANWFSSKFFGKYLTSDLKIRKYIDDNLRHAGINNVEIERNRNEVSVTIFTSRPGIVIGHKGEGINKVKTALSKLDEGKIKVNVKEIRKPEIHAQIMAEQVAYQIEKRAPFRRVLKNIMGEIRRNPQALGAKLRISGRLGGTEISRAEHIEEGSLPLQTLRADIDYGFALARTKFGSIGCKVWINRGEYKEDKE